MKTGRFIIDDMVDAHVWMRQQEASLKRVLTLDSVPGDLLAEYGLWRGGAGAASYRCIDPHAVLVPIAEITAPARKLNPDALRSLLRGVRDGDNLPPVVVFREPGAVSAALLDGLHRYWVSVALGFSSIPAIQVSRKDAEAGYRYANM
jgi:hypothetical protein